MKIEVRWAGSGVVAAWAGAERPGRRSWRLTTSTLNRVMVVEEAMPAVLPAAFVAWHYIVQLSRPRWGYGSDIGHRRTPWIIGGMGVLAAGRPFVAADATVMMAHSPVLGSLLTAMVGLHHDRRRRRRGGHVAAGAVWPPASSRLAVRPPPRSPG